MGSSFCDQVLKKKYQNQVERALAVRRQLSAKAGGGMGCGQLPAELGVYVLFPLQVGSQPLGGAFLRVGSHNSFLLSI